MMNNIKRLLVFALVLISIIQCSKKNPTEADNNKEIWPLDIGNTWVYVLNSQTDKIVQSMTVIGLKNINNLEIPMIKWEDHESGYSDTSLFNSEDDGIYGYSEEGSKFLVFKYPVKVGEFWFNPFEGGKIECISTNKTVQTPAGKFNCIVYRFYGEERGQSLKIYLEAYMCPNIGWVANKKIDDDQEDEWYYLKSYQINR